VTGVQTCALPIFEEVFRMRADGLTLRHIAGKFSVDRQTITKILHGQTYRDCDIDTRAARIVG